MFSTLWATFSELIRTPFQHVDMIWGIVPLYFGLLLNELTSSKANFQTAIQTGFSFVWAGAQWLYPYLMFHGSAVSDVEIKPMPPLNLVVTAFVLLCGVVALISGLLKRFPRHGKFLGHTRFANYFMIAIFPIQANYLQWTWMRLAALALFAIPIWLTLHYALMPLRNRK